jgi:ribosome maturation factor RimP
MPEEDEVGRIEETIVPVLRDHGLELVDVEWRGHGPRGLLRVYVDKPGGVGIKDCERVSREVGDVLDVANLIERAYDLEVSSPGLDRTLKKDREYRWAIGKRVRCRLAEGGEVAGRLVDVTDDRLVLDVGGARRDVARLEVRRTRLEPDVPWPRQA